MTFTQAIRVALIEKYATFEGRAGRAEYWWFMLFTALIGLPVYIWAGFPSALDGIDPVFNPVGLVAYMLWCAVAFIPILAISARRLHDVGLSGWWQLLGIAPVAGLLPTGPDNRFGPARPGVPASASAGWTTGPQDPAQPLYRFGPDLTSGTSSATPVASYDQATAYPAVTHRETDGLGIAALVIGLVALVVCWIPVLNLPVLLLALVGIGLGIAAIARAKRLVGPRGMATAGLILSGVALAIGITVDTTVIMWANSSNTSTAAAEYFADVDDAPAAPSPGSVEEAIGAWMSDNAMVYAGPCEQTTLDQLDQYCSSVVEDRGSEVVADVGPTFSEYTTSLLIERTDGGWLVTGVSSIDDSSYL